MIKAGITGNDLYAMGELLRLLHNHPDVETVFIDSEENEHRKLAETYKWMTWENVGEFTNGSSLDKVDLLFCCHKDNVSMTNFMRTTTLPHDLKIIDMSPANRPGQVVSEGFVYGLPELNRRAVCSSQYVSLPGEMATAVELALLPLARNLLLNKDITVNIVAGTSCFRNTLPGIKPMSLVAPFDEATTQEVRHTMRAMQNSFDSDIIMLPVTSQLRRGIMAVVSTEINVKLDELKQIYKDYYEEDSFTFLVDNASLEYVMGTNKCFLHLNARGNKLAITSCIDNMMKGCAGQAVHNMNLLFNLEETTGLKQTAMLM